MECVCVLTSVLHVYQWYMLCTVVLTQKFPRPRSPLSHHHISIILYHLCVCRWYNNYITYTNRWYYITFVCVCVIGIVEVLLLYYQLVLFCLTEKKYEYSIEYMYLFS